MLPILARGVNLETAPRRSASPKEGIVMKEHYSYPEAAKTYIDSLVTTGRVILPKYYGYDRLDHRILRHDIDVTVSVVRGGGSVLIGGTMYWLYTGKDYVFPETMPYRIGADGDGMEFTITGIEPITAENTYVTVFGREEFSGPMTSHGPWASECPDMRDVRISELSAKDFADLRDPGKPVRSKKTIWWCPWEPKKIPGVG